MTHTPKIGPHIELLQVSASAREGVCPLSATLTPASITRFTTLVEVNDPHHRLLQAARLAKGPHPDSKTSNSESGVTYIQSPGHELSFSTGREGGMKGFDSTTQIGLQIQDPWLLALQLSEAGLVDSDVPHAPLTAAVAYQLVRWMVSRLKGFAPLAGADSSPALSPAAGILLASIGDSVTDTVAVASQLESFLMQDHPGTCCPDSVAAEVSACSVGRLGLNLAGVLPAELPRTHERQEAWCEGCPVHGASPAARDGWKLEAWPSAKSVAKTQAQIHSAFQSA